MSRFCYECDSDGNCLSQDNGTYSCGAGSPKTRERIIAGMDNRVIELIPELAAYAEKYNELDDPKRALVLRNIIYIIKQEYDQPENKEERSND